MRVVLTATAERDLVRVYDFIATDSPTAAANFVDEFKRVCCDTLSDCPHLDVARDDVSRGLRIHRRRKYLIC